VPIYSDEALEDLRAIRGQIAKDSPQRAAEKAVMIDDTCKLLDNMPKIGRVFSALCACLQKNPVSFFMSQPTRARGYIASLIAAGTGAPSLVEKRRVAIPRTLTV
jgi:hypothetical protein